MKERPILFNAEMVRAILDGRKTMTRRVVHPDINVPENEPDYILYRCPYGKPGDRLWVRERTRLIECLDVPWLSGFNGNDKGRFRYEADGTETDWIEYPSRLALLQKDYCVPNGCYKEASRINLEITDIRVERVQDITPEGSLAEGLDMRKVNAMRSGHMLIYEFQRLWDSINAKRGYEWANNPFVWVITFKQINA
jgi:hypothetical protein